MNQLLLILQRARARISQPANWLQRLDAANQHRRRVDAKHPSACAWCMLGAIQAECTDGVTVAQACGALALDPALYATNAVVMFNDSHTHTEVLALMDRAIERLT